MKPSERIFEAIIFGGPEHRAAAFAGIKPKDRPRQYEPSPEELDAYNQSQTEQEAYRLAN
jgi:hypothetical protein